MMSSPNWLLFTFLASQNCCSIICNDIILFNPSWLLLVTFNVVVIVVFVFVGIHRNGLTQLNH